MSYLRQKCKKLGVVSEIKRVENYTDFEKLLTNRMWFSVVYSLIDNDTLHHSGQNVTLIYQSDCEITCNCGKKWFIVKNIEGESTEANDLSHVLLKCFCCVNNSKCY